MDNIDALYAYLKGRSDGAITRAEVEPMDAAGGPAYARYGSDGAACAAPCGGRNAAVAEEAPRSAQGLPGPQQPAVLQPEG